MKKITSSLLALYLLITALLVATLLLSSASAKTPQDFAVIDSKGNELSNIIVEIKQTTGTHAITRSDGGRSIATMEQIDQQFVPHILPIATGQSVVFPNIDDVFHHVYSFSPAKTFEITLEQTVTSDPISFDEAGIVELGCNVHDWMLGYIYVSGADVFGQTDLTGNFAAALPAGEYEISIWHPRLHEDDMKASYQIQVGTSSEAHKLQLSKPLYPSLTGYDNVEVTDAY